MPVVKIFNGFFNEFSKEPIFEINSIRHTFVKNRYTKNPQSLKMIARQSNTSPKMIHINYLDEDDVMMFKEYRKMYSKK